MNTGATPQRQDAAFDLLPGDKLDAVALGTTDGTACRGFPSTSLSGQARNRGRSGRRRCRRCPGAGFARLDGYLEDLQKDVKPS
jgi:hypothetical protein